MAASRRSSQVEHPIVLTFLIFAILGFMYFAAEVLQPLALALILSLALSPLAAMLERRKVPRAAAVVLSVVMVLGGLGALGWIVSRQVFSLAEELTQPELRHNLEEKISFLKPTQENAIDKLAKVGSEVAETLDKPVVPTNIEEAKAAGADRAEEPESIQDVRVVSRPTFQERFQDAVGPWLQILAVGSVVLILVVFLMISREDLSERVIQLVGTNRISLTTRTLEEMGSRISRYLAILLSYNATMGAVLGLGLWLIGVPYAATWAVIGALLRFIPYAGPVTAFLLPGTFAAAYFDGWSQALMVVGIYATLETIMSSFFEPIMYGRTTGVSAVGLLVAIMFWTWLWGTFGLLLATPLTVCLAVLGKYIPQLRVFATLLGEESELPDDVRFYQRLLALDQDGAVDLIDEALGQRPRVEVYDTVLIPALSRAERDRVRGEIDDPDQAFVWRVVGEILDDLEGRRDLDLETVNVTPKLPPGSVPEAGQILGVAANDEADALVLRMLRQLLEQSNCPMEVVTAIDSPLALNEVVAERSPKLVLLSHLPPVGLSPARYLIRRLRARQAELPILVGRWGERGNAKGAAERLDAAGATEVAFSLSDARKLILRTLDPHLPTGGEPESRIPEPAAAGES